MTKSANSALLSELANPKTRANALERLGLAARPGNAKAVARFAGASDLQARLRALEYLRYHADGSFASVVMAGLEDEEELLVATAIECLVEWGIARASARIAKLLTHPSELVAGYAAWAVGKLGDRRHLPLLRARFRKESRGVVSSAIAESCYRLTRTQRYADHLLRQLTNRDPEVRAFTSNSLVGIADERNEKRIEKALERALQRETFPAIREVLKGNLALVRAE